MTDNDHVEFQVISWVPGDVEDDDDQIDRYCVKLFGRNAAGESVAVSVTGFTPYFYIKLAARWNKRQVASFVEILAAKLPMRFKESVSDARVMSKMDFWGFTNKEMFPFLRVCFTSERAMRAAARVLATPGKVVVNGVYQRKFKLYESNISPMLRLAHIKNISPCGWVRVARPSKAVVLESCCQHDLQTHWSHIEGIDKADIAPIVIASFDIECTSSDGDFPVARKNYCKVANDIYNIIHADAKGNSWRAAMIELVAARFSSGALVPFKPNVTRDMLENIILEHADHIKLIVDGDVSVVNPAVRTLFNATFESSGSAHFAVFMAFVKKIGGDEKGTALRKSMLSWLMKCFASNKSNLKRGLQPGSSAAEDTAEGIVRLCMREKDGIVDVLAKYLDGILPPVKGDEIIQIGVTVHRYGESECSQRMLFNLGSCDAIDGCRVIACQTETELLGRWAACIREIDPDVICGYNIFGFDFAYIHHRSLELGCSEAVKSIGRLADMPAEFKEARLSSSALGDNTMYFYDMPGRTNIDLMKVVQRDHKLDSYKLDHVARHFTGMAKNDMTPAEIFSLFKGSSTDRAKVGAYCIQDCELCNKLVMKLEILANNMGMANVCSVPLSFIFMRGQGVKIFSLVAKQCKELGYLIPTIALEIRDDDQDVGGYEGAIVLEPKTGIYIDTPVAVLDYASLYPSSMISENLSHDCLVLDAKYDNLPGVDYQVVSYDVYEGSGDEKVKVGEKVCRYAHHECGVIPNILMHLLKQRKVTRKKMNLKVVELQGGDTAAEGYLGEDGRTLTTTDDRVLDLSTLEHTVRDKYNAFQKATLDGLQNAYKVTANSLYGQVGSRTSPIYLKDIAACTTATGRQMILQAKGFMEKEYDAHVVYGDSVTGYTPVFVRHNSMTFIDTIENVATRFGKRCGWRTCVEPGKQDKDAFELADGVDVWTEAGWTKVLRVIRHALPASKRVLRVSTSSGFVDATDDHSMLTRDVKEVSPAELQPGDTLLTHPFPSFVGQTHTSITESVARFMGMFMARGHANGLVVSIMTYSPDEAKHIHTWCQQVRPEADWNISGRYVRSYSSTVTNDILDTMYCGKKYMVVPYPVLQCPSIRTRRAFWDEYKAWGTMRFYSQVGAQSMMVLLNSIGITASVMPLDKQVHTYQLLLANGNAIEPGVVVGCCTPIDYDGYVYDLTTENHHFAAGVGDLICHNTDSLFVTFPTGKTGKEALQPTIDIATQASQKFKPLLKHPHDLEYEKTFWPFILFSKKRYVANQYGNSTKLVKQSSMGIVLKRRDNAQIVKTIYGGVIDIILNQHDIEAAVKFLKDTLLDLIRGRFTLDDLVISKTLKAHYKDPTKIAHKVLADRIKERSPGNAPQTNDRIPYVYIFSETPGKLLQGQRIEHPNYIKEKDLRPDYEFYILNQIMNPVLQLFSIVLERLEGYQLADGHWGAAEKKLRLDGKPDKYIKEKIRDMRELEAKKLLFDPILQKLAKDPELLRLKNKRNGNRTITEWYGIRA